MATSIIALGLCIETFRALLNDGRPLRPPASHWQDPLFMAPGRQIEQAHWGAVSSPDPWPREQAPLGSAAAPPEVLQIGRHS